MAIFHLNAKVISRGKGQSAIAAAAYRSGERLRDEQSGEQKFYTSRAERIQFTDIMAPKDAPEWAHDRNRLWNEAERAEKRKDAQLAREIEVSLPHELTGRQREWLVKDFAREAFVRHGYAVDIAIHAPDKDSDDRNHHAHLMVTMRTMGLEGFAATKDRSLNSKEQLGAWREQWAHLANRHLERHGHEARIDHRSLQAQGADREPTLHLGYAAKEIAQRGGQSDRMAELRGILDRNQIRVDVKALDHELAGLERQQAAAEKEAAQQRRQATERVAEQQRQAPIPQPTRRTDIEHATDATKAKSAPPLQMTPIRQAEADAAQKRQDSLRKLDQANRADQQPKPEGKAFADSACDQAQEVRQQRRDERQDTTQAAWREQRAAEVKRVTGASRGRVDGGGLRVVSGVTGSVSSLGDFMLGLFGGSSVQQPEEKKPARGFTTDPAARKEQHLARLAESRAAEADQKALERMRQDMEAGKDLRVEDIQRLTHEHQMQIFEKGDDGVRDLVRDAHKKSQEYLKGEERERDR